jgi:hypothetical protein
VDMWLISWRAHSSSSKRSCGMAGGIAGSRGGGGGRIQSKHCEGGGY